MTTTDARRRTVRSLAGRIGALSLHSQGKTDTGPARRAFMGRFDREVDPDGVLPPAERLRRAELARKLYFTRLSLKSVQKARRARQRKAGRAGNFERAEARNR